MACESKGDESGMTMASDAPEKVKDGDSDMLYDFSCLPEPVWVKVFEFLPLTDKYHVSLTCHSLSHVFNHPSNWKSARLSAAGGRHNFGLTYSGVQNRFKAIVEKFGHIFQRLTVSIHGHLIRMNNETREILVHMSEICRLEHLVLEVGVMTSDFHLHGLRPLQEDIKSILKLVDTAFRVKKIEILSWPMFPEMFTVAEINVFEAMKKNPKLENLESLSLFSMKNKQWSERSPLLPSPSYTTSLLSHFRCLKHLAIRSPMLSNDLFQELAHPSRVKLETLQILVSYVAQDSSHSLPEISSSSWTSLLKKSPALEVEMVVLSRIADIDLAALLKPEVPLTAFKVLKYARCSDVMLHSLTEKFKTTLKSFICYTDPAHCDQQLLRLVQNCLGLNTLVFHGQIHYSTLMDIVKEHSHWKEFDFIESSIVTEPVGEEFDEDTVIGRSVGGNLVQVRLVQFHGQQTDTERKELLDALKAEVSKRMDYSWKPSKSSPS